MSHMILAPPDTPGKACIKTDQREWAIFVQLMKDQGRSASDRVRELVRETVREYEKDKQRARS